jgi:DNA-directed RNA polymerase sigma subunit (sigma70/sigma32)
MTYNIHFSLVHITSANNKRMMPKCLERKRTMKRTRKWVTTALVVLATVMVDLDGSLAFSPSSSDVVRAKNNAERRRSKRVVNQGSPEEESSSSSHRRGGSGTGTDLNVAMSTANLLNIYPVSDIGRVKKHTTRSTSKQQHNPKPDAGIVSLPASSWSVSLGKRNRSSRMVRPQSRNSSPRLDGKTVTTDREGLLDKTTERKLTISIRSLRRAIRIRDNLVETSDSIPSEAEWAEACGLSVLGLRRDMYEGQQARTVLVSANAGLVTSIAKRHLASLKFATQAGGGVGTILTIQDLIQEGNLGLMQAAERFESDRGHRFSTYATYWIRQRILRSISDSSRIIRLPAHGKFIDKHQHKVDIIYQHSDREKPP